MAYDDLVSRTEAAPLQNEVVLNEIVGEAIANSAVLSMASRIQDATTNQTRIPVWSSLPTASFKNGDTALIASTDFSWENVYCNIEEISCYVPIADVVLEDSNYDIFGQARPFIGEAIGKAVDAAVFHETNKPSTWTWSGIVSAASSAGNTLSLATHSLAGGDIYSALAGESGIMAMVETDGCMNTGSVNAISMLGKLRGVRGDDGHPIFVQNPTLQGAPSAVCGVPAMFPRNGGLSAASALQIVGDWTKIKYSIRKDISYRVVVDGVIQDGAGNIIYNLTQQGMACLLVRFRVGIAFANPPNRVNSNSSTRYPFAVLTP